MDSRTKLTPTLLSLVSEYENYNFEVQPLYLTDKEFHQIIEFYEDDNELDSALEVIDRAMRRYPYRPDFLNVKTRILIKKSKFDEAMAIIEQTEIMSPYQIENQLLKANIFIHQGCHDEASNLLEELKSYGSKVDLGDIYIAEAFLFESLGEYDTMFQCLKQALIISPTNEEALKLMNISMDQSRNYEEGILIHKVIINNHPYTHLAWFNLGHALACVGEYESVIDTLEYSFIIEPTFEQGYFDCADYCIQFNEYQRALDIYLEALDVFGSEFDLLMSIAQCQFHLDMVDRAKRSLFEAIELDSYNDEAYFLLAKCYRKNEDWLSAIKIITKAIDIECGNEEYFHLLADAHDKRGEKNQAKEFYKKAAVAGYEQTKYWEDYVLFLIKNVEYKTALTTIAEADKLTFSAKLEYLKAGALLGDGKRAEALVHMENALEESFDEHVVIYELPEVIAKDNSFASIIAYFSS